MLLKRRAEEILTLVDMTERELAEQDELVEGRITFGCGELMAVQVLPAIIEKFRQRYPGVSYDIFTGNADVVREQMEKGIIDIGVLLEPVDIERFEFIRLDEKERWVVLMRPDDELAKKKVVKARDLKGRPLILPRRTNVQNELTNRLGDSFDTKQVVFTSNLSTNSAIMVQAGLAYSIVIEGSVPFWDKEKITYRPLYPEFTSGSVIAWKKGAALSPAVSKFIEYTKCFLGITET